MKSEVGGFVSRKGAKAQRRQEKEDLGKCGFFFEAGKISHGGKSMMAQNYSKQSNKLLPVFVALF